MNEDLTKLFRGIPGYELVQYPPGNPRKWCIEWEESLPVGTLTVMVKLSGTDADYDPICWLLPLDEKDAKIRALEAELAAYKAKYDPRETAFVPTCNPTVARADEPRGPELADWEDDGA